MREIRSANRDRQRAKLVESPAGRNEGPTVAGTGLLLGLAQTASLYFDPWHHSQVAIYQATLSAHARFGAAPCSRPKAAAHVTGRVIVACALGATVEGASITRCAEAGRDVWIGETSYISALDYRGATARQDPSLAMRSAACKLAGFLGEQFAGLGHPSSSIAERCIALRYCQAISDIGDASLEQVIAEICGFCLAAFERNRMAFDAVRDRLYQRLHLTKAEADRMLAGVCAP